MKIKRIITRTFWGAEPTSRPTSGRSHLNALARVQRSSAPLPNFSGDVKKDDRIAARNGWPMSTGILPLRHKSYMNFKQARAAAPSLKLSLGGTPWA